MRLPPARGPSAARDHGRLERGDLVQAGEPYSHQYDPEAERWRATYTTFAKVDGEWTYCGKCFVGKTKEPQGLPKA